MNSGQKFRKQTASLVPGKLTSPSYKPFVNHSCAHRLCEVPGQGSAHTVLSRGRRRRPLQSLCFGSLSPSHSEWHLRKVRAGMDGEPPTCPATEGPGTSVPCPLPPAFPALSTSVLTQKTGSSRTAPEETNARPSSPHFRAS